MKINELQDLTRTLLQERIINVRINQLQNDPNVNDYLTLRHLSKIKIESDIEIIDRILKSYKITPTNDLWILTGAFITDYCPVQDDVFTYNKKVDLNDSSAEFKEYINLESLESNRINLGQENNDKKFQEERLVLYPFGNKKMNRDVSGIRNEFVLDSINCGQEEAKAKLLGKYRRII